MRLKKFLSAALSAAMLISCVSFGGGTVVQAAGEMNIARNLQISAYSGTEGDFPVSSVNDGRGDDTQNDNYRWFSKEALKLLNGVAIRKAAEIACIWDYIETLPQGLETVLTERGEGLSEGQVQRIAIARAILNDAPILLLDECTSSLDKDTEWKVLQNLKKMNTKTIICISHTAAGVACCDRVVEIENKKFKEVSNDD